MRGSRTPAIAVAFGTAIVVLALSLRSGVGSLGVALPEVRTALDLAPATTSVLTALPALCFAVVGLGAGAVILRFGVHRVAVALLIAIAVGLLLRASTSSGAVFLVATALAMAGAAIGNVVLPPLAKRHFPDRLPLISALYGAAVVGGATIASAATVPISDALGDWRWGLGGWAVLAVLGALLWVPAVRRDPPAAGGPTRHTISLREVARTRIGVGLALLFGAQSAQAYVQFGWWGEIMTEAGADAAHAGALLAVITGVGIPVTLSLPALIALTGRSLTLPITSMVVTLAGWAGVLTAPLAAGGFPWAVMLGVGGGAFTWTLAMIGRSARTHDGTAQLSALTQGVGYVFASVATFGAGILHDLTGSWTASVTATAVLSLGIGLAGSVVVRSGTLEDQLPST